MYRRDERGERGGGDPRDLRERLDIVLRVPGGRARVDLVVSQQDPERLTAGLTELILVDFLEELTLIELKRPRHVVDEFSPRDVQDPDLDPFASFGNPAREVLQASPGSFKPLVARMMDDGVELPVDQGIDAGDVPIQQTPGDLPRRQDGRLRVQAEPAADRLPGRRFVEKST